MYVFKQNVVIFLVAASSLEPSSAVERVTQKPHGNPMPQGSILVEDLARKVIEKYSEMMSAQHLPTLKSLCAPLPPAHDAGTHATQTPHGVITQGK